MLNKGAVFLGIVFIAAFETQSYAAEIADAINMKTGMISYSTVGFLPQSGSNAQNLGIEYSRYLAKDSAIVIGYHMMSNALTGRTQYQSGSVSYRIFPFTLGVPLRQRVESDMIEYRFFWKPYFDIGMSYGRYSLGTFETNNALEFSSSTLGIPMTFGLLVQVMQALAIDVAISYEQIFGHSSPLAFGGTHMGFLFGGQYYF